MVFPARQSNFFDPDPAPFTRVDLLCHISAQSSSTKSTCSSLQALSTVWSQRSHNLRQVEAGVLARDAVVACHQLRAHRASTDGWVLCGVKDAAVDTGEVAPVYSTPWSGAWGRNGRRKCFLNG